MSVYRYALCEIAVFKCVIIKSDRACCNRDKSLPRARVTHILEVIIFKKGINIVIEVDKVKEDQGYYSHSLIDISIPSEYYCRE